MSEKPSLYVVERKEVVILVVLFVLVTVLSFTVGVRYGEKIGRKLSREEMSAQREHDGETTEKNGGTLGNVPKVESASEKSEKTEGASSDKLGGVLGGGEAGAKTENKEAKPVDEGKKVEAKHDGDPHAVAPVPSSTVNAVDANSDEALLSALKGSGVEPPSAKLAGAGSLPEEPKSIKSGSFVIQVGSHPTKHEAEEQVRGLQSHQISTQVLAPFKDNQGEWFRVVIGPYKTKLEAEKEAKLLKTKGFIFSFFVRKM